MIERRLDRIHIRDLLLRGIVGINEDERQKKQDVVINLTLELNLRRAGRSDDIEDTANYRTITKQIIDFVETSDFFLVERLAEGIAEICLREAEVERVTVVVEKPGALRFSRSVGVEITRERSI
ncbi:MAG: dihydroneopterin aldolase [bacterium]